MPNNKTGLKLKASVLALGLLGVPLAVNAAGIGRLTVLSALGQPLRAEIELSASKDEISSLVAKLGTPDQFRQQGVEFSPSLGSVALSVEKRANGQPYVKMVSDRPINEPFLDVLVELTWASGRLLREYTFLLDPPELARKATPATVNVPEVRVSGPGVSSAPVRAEAADAAESSKLVKGAKKAAPAPKVVDKAEKGEKAEKPEAPAKVEKKAEATPAAETAGDKAAPAGTHEVRKGETLGKIAAEHAYEGVSLDQMLVAIFNGNKEAFAGENINRLKAGKILNLPSREEAASVTQGEARKTIAVHSANFEAYRAKLASGAATAPAGDSASDQASSGKIAPKVEDKAPAPKAGGDTVVISKTELGKSAKAGKAGDEDKIAAERALKEEKARVAALEKNIADLKKLNEAQSKSLADAEKQASSKKAAADKAAADKLAADKAAADKAASEKAAAEKAAAEKAEAEKVAAEKAAAEKAAAEKAEADKLAAEKAAAEAAKPADAPVAEAPAAEPKAEDAPPPPKKPVVMPPPAPVAQPSFVEENPGLVFGGGGLLAALLAALGFREWKRRKAAVDVEPASQFGDASAMSSVFGSTGGQSVDTNNISIGDNFSQSSLGGGDASAGVDPVAEAEVYMAYGRDAQAEEILLEAMKTDPKRLAIHHKLLELYAARRSARPFEEVAREVQQQTGGIGPDWEKAVTLGKSIDPDNPLYGGAPALAVPSAGTTVADNDMDFGTSTVIMPPGQLAKLAAAEPPVSTLQLDQPLIEPAAAAESAASNTIVLDSPVAPAAEAAPALDFDLDLGGVEPAVEAVPAVIDFDLDLGGNASAPAADTPQGLSLDLNVESSAPAESMPEISFDLELPSISKPEPDAPAISTDFDFNLDTPAESPAIEMAAPEVESPVADALPPMDFGGIDLSLETPAAEPAQVESIQAEPMQFEASGSVVDAGMAAPDAEDNPEVATKLELAQAYEEMGDKEGMRELLQEVLAEGSPAQQDVARNKLAQHGLS